MKYDVKYPECRIVTGTKDAFEKSFADFLKHEPDDVRITDADKVFPDVRRTIAGEASVAGVGTFKGSEKQTLVFAPSDKPGWWVRRTDQSEQLDTGVHIANLWTSARNLVLRSGSPHNYLRMAEHIIALKLGLGVDNVVVKSASGDPPLFDASSLPLVKALEHAGIVETSEKATWVAVREPLAFAGTRGDFLMFLPPENGRKVLRLDVGISWNDVIGRQRIVFDVTPETFTYGAFARTNATRRQYILAATIGKLFADTRNLGYDKDNILIHGRKYYGKPRLQLPGTDKFLEPVWHRATLDLLAALTLTGADRFVGTVVSYRAGHTQDCDAMRKLYRDNLICNI